MRPGCWAAVLWLGTLTAGCGGRRPAPQGAAAAAMTATPAPPASDGATDWFGPGVTALRQDGALLKVELARPASVAALQLYAEGSVRLVGVHQLPAGATWLQVPPRVGTRAAAPAYTNTRNEPPLSDGCIAFEGRTGVVAAPGSPPPRNAPTPGCYRIVRTPSAATGAPGGAEASSRGAGTRRRLTDYILLVVSDSIVTTEQLAERMLLARSFEFETVTHDLPEFLVGRRTPMWAGYLVTRR